MKVGRNDPCPCGSGEKYKKCCIEKENSRMETQTDSQTPDPNYLADIFKSEYKPSEKPDDFSVQFKAASFDEKLTIIQNTLKNPDMKDEKELFSQLLDIFNQDASDPDRRNQYNDLRVHIKTNHPKTYDHISGDLFNHAIANALTDSQEEGAAQLFKEFAHLAGDKTDQFYDSLEQIAYYGHLSLLIDVMKIAWSAIQKVDEISPWVVTDFSSLASNYELFDYLESNEKPNPSDPELIQKLNQYIEPDPIAFYEYFNLISGDFDKTWGTGDFKIKAKNGKRGNSKADVRKNITRLTNDFLRYAYKQGVAYPKAEIMRTEINAYLQERFNGELDQPPVSFKDTPSNNKKSFDSLLCPDQDTLRRFLANKFHMLGNRPYRAAACFEAIPLWITFLKELNLIESDTHQQTFVAISALQADLQEILSKLCKDFDFILNSIKKAWIKTPAS